MRDGFDGFRRASPKGVDRDDVAPAHLGEQPADRRLLGRDRDVDGPAVHEIDKRALRLIRAMTLRAPMRLASIPDRMLIWSSLVTAQKTSV